MIKSNSSLSQPRWPNWMSRSRWRNLGAEAPVKSLIVARRMALPIVRVRRRGFDSTSEWAERRGGMSRAQGTDLYEAGSEWSLSWPCTRGSKQLRRRRGNGSAVPCNTSWADALACNGGEACATVESYGPRILDRQRVLFANRGMSAFGQGLQVSYRRAVHSGRQCATMVRGEPAVPSISAIVDRRRNA